MTHFNFENKMNIWKILYLNWGEWYEDMTDHRSYAHNLSSCEIKAWKNIQDSMGFEPTTSVILVCTVLYQLSYQAIWELVT